MKPFKLTEPAERDLTEIWVYIAEDSIEAANKVNEELVGCFLLLCDNPKLGVEQSQIRENLRSLVHKNYIIFYSATNDCIQIFRVLHGARDIENLFDAN